MGYGVQLMAKRSLDIRGIGMAALKQESPELMVLGANPSLEIQCGYWTDAKWLYLWVERHAEEASSGSNRTYLDAKYRNYLDELKEACVEILADQEQCFGFAKDVQRTISILDTCLAYRKHWDFYFSTCKNCY
jgi:hypothetical protein